MAAGDVFTLILNPAAGAYAYYQPAAGVETLITAIAMEGSTTSTVGLTNGILVAANFIAYPANPNDFSNLKITLTNTNYLSCRNTAGAPRQFGLTGIQLK